MPLLMCTQTNRHTLQLALFDGGGCGGKLYIYIFKSCMINYWPHAQDCFLHVHCTLR